jgi:leucyl-tRNA synthetase
MVNSGKFNGLSWDAGARAVVEELKAQGRADFKVHYKLRDWLISRQRYWGAPIPIVFCASCGEVPVPEKDLPVLLPADVDFTPRGDGKSPLAHFDAFVHTTCPRCEGPARRETDTMDTFVCSSWYFLRYLSPHRNDAPFDTALVRRWLPVDQYVGGAEHAVMHLMYARFITMVLHDLGHIHFEEPFTRLRHQGTITNRGAKMSKSKGNVINPENFLEQFGSDTFRMYLMFMGSYEEGGDWDDTGINGIHRFLGRVWRLYSQYGRAGHAGRTTETLPGDVGEDERRLLRVMHFTIKNVGADLENFEFNTAIARLMELVNALYLYLQRETPPDGATLNETLLTLNILLAPFAPHMSEEIWSRGGGRRSVFLERWPSYDDRYIIQDTVTIAVQVNGKLRSELEVAKDLDDERVLKQVLEIEKIKKIVGEKPLRKAIVVKNRIVNLVV